MKQQDLFRDAPTAPRSAQPGSSGQLCQNPGCLYTIVDESEEHCSQCGEAILEPDADCKSILQATEGGGGAVTPPVSAPAPPDVGALPAESSRREVGRQSEGAGEVGNCPDEDDSGNAEPNPSPSGAGPGSKAARIVALASQAILTDAEKGELNFLLNRHLNTNSPKLLDKLYGEPPAGWGFPRRFIKIGNRNTDRLARSVDALLASYRQKQDRRLELCLLLSDRLTQLESLNAKLDKDGRIRFALNIAGTKVGRFSCYRSNTGSGYGLHSTQEKQRLLFVADTGFDMYSVDLTGADTYTVAAECRALGDSTMWDDLQAGLKPAKVLSVLYLEGESANRLPRSELAVKGKALPKDWLYDAAKKATHGSNYGEGDVRMAETILRDSWEAGDGTLAAVTAAQCKRLQNLYFARYPGVRRWQERVRMLLKRDGFLTAASGLKRDFFGLKADHATQKEAFAFAPAANTAFCCNSALLKVWQDRSEGVQLLFTHHDSLLLQAPVARREWMRQQIPKWFHNPICVAGTTFVIPHEALIGPSWGELLPL